MHKMNDEYLVIATFICWFETSGKAATKSGFKKNVQILEFMTFYQNALHLTRVHYATIYQSALRHKQHHDVTASSRRHFS